VIEKIGRRAVDAVKAVGRFGHFMRDLARAVPDVAVNGDAETGIVIGLTQRFPDGTDRYAERRHASDESATAVFAGLVALANQAAGHDLGFLNPAMYALRSKEPGAYRDVVPLGNLDEERDDDRRDHRHPGERGRGEVDLPEALVAPVAAETPDRLAATAEEDDRGEDRHHRERLQPEREVAADPDRGHHHEPEPDRERG